MGLRGWPAFGVFFSWSYCGGVAAPAVGGVAVLTSSRGGKEEEGGGAGRPLGGGRAAAPEERGSDGRRGDAQDDREKREGIAHARRVPEHDLQCGQQRVERDRGGEPRRQAMAPFSCEAEERRYHVAKDEKDAEQKRTNPDYLKDVPPAPPSVIASHFDGTSPDEAGHLPEDEKKK